MALVGLYPLYRIADVVCQHARRECYDVQTSSEVDEGGGDAGMRQHSIGFTCSMEDLVGLLLVHKVPVYPGGPDTWKSEPSGSLGDAVGQLVPIYVGPCTSPLFCLCQPPQLLGH